MVEKMGRSSAFWCSITSRSAIRSFETVRCDLFASASFRAPVGRRIKDCDGSQHMKGRKGDE